MYLHTIEVFTIDGGQVTAISFQAVTPQARVRVRHRSQRVELPDRDDIPLIGGEDWGDWEEFE